MTDAPRFSAVKAGPDEAHKDHHGGPLVSLVFRIVDRWRAFRDDLSNAGSLQPHDYALSRMRRATWARARQLQVAVVLGFVLVLVSLIASMTLPGTTAGRSAKTIAYETGATRPASEPIHAAEPGEVSLFRPLTDW